MAVTVVAFEFDNKDATSKQILIDFQNHKKTYLQLRYCLQAHIYLGFQQLVHLNVL